MIIQSKPLAVVVVAVIAGGILLSMALGQWKTESEKVPARYTSGEFEGAYNPGDIRGSYTFADIESAFGIPSATLARAFGFGEADNPGAIQVKELEELYGEIGDVEIGTDSVRHFVALYLGLPYTPEETTGLPNPALSILRSEGKVTDEQFTALKEKAVNTAAETTEASGTTGEAAGGGIVTGTTGTTGTTGGTAAAATHTEDSATDTTIKGKTTFRELLDWGVSREAIERVIGQPMGPATMTVRDFCANNGVEFSTVKSELQAEIDKATAN